MDGQLTYTDALGRGWVVTKDGQKWRATTSSDPNPATDYNLYQLFQQIDKRSK